MNETAGPLPPSMRRIDPDYYEGHPERRKEVIKWMDDHGINPMWVLRDARIEFLDEHTLEIEVYDMPSGIPEWDRESGRVKTRWLNIKMLRPFPMDCVA